MYKNLSNNEKKQAKKEIVNHFKSKELKPQVDQVFPN
jgi:NADPH:quinone reductase-like Zn-dependent oxidoreductase